MSESGVLDFLDPTPQDVLKLTDLSHVYFAGAIATEAIRPEDQSPLKPRFPGPRQRGLVASKKNGLAESEPLKPLSPLLTFILCQSGLAAENYQAKALHRRFAACLRMLRVHSEQAGLSRLQQNPQLLARSLSALLIGVSEFFRDEAVFEQLRQEVLPVAVKRTPALRVYSAGCSAGQELYSVAILLDELGALETSQLLGVDCRQEAIAQARSGSYSLSELKGVEATRRQRYFCTEGRRAFIANRLRQRTEWRAADFGEFQAAEPWDVILFRNVAIYLAAPYATRVWHRLDQQLRPGGVAVTGSADHPPEDLPWRREAACIYRKSLS